MILRLMRYHLAPPFAIAFSLLCAASIVALPAFGLALGLPFFFVIWRAMPRRGSRFEAGLPIHGRQIVLARMFSALLVVLLPLVAWAVAQLVRGHPDSSTPQMLEYVAIATLAVMLPFAQRAGELTEPAAWRVVVPWMLLAAASALILDKLTAATGLVIFSLAIVTTCYVLQAAVPAALQVASMAIHKHASADAPTSGDAPTPPVSFAPWRIVLRSTFSPRTIFWIPLLILGSWMGNSFFYLFIVTLSVTPIVRYRIRWMSALPLSNRSRLGMLLVPCVVVSLACLMIGRAIHTAPFRPKDRAAREAPTPSHNLRYRKNRTQVPLEYWGRVRNGRHPIITAPWGESVEADTISILGVMLANPFSTDAQSSQRFVEWQFERATAATFGRSISMASYDSSATLPPTVLSTPRMQFLNAGAIVSTLLLLIFLIELGHWNLFKRQHLIPKLGDAASILPIGVVMGIYFYYENRRDVNVVVAAAESALRSLSNALPPRVFVVFLAAVAPVVLSYAMLEWQFGRAELTARIKSDAS